MRIIKDIVWHIIFMAINLVGPHRVSYGKNRLLILTYHRVLPKADKRINYEQPGMYVTEQSFDLQMRLIQRYFTLMPLNEWLTKAKCNEPLPDRACAITFDDGWQDNYAYAYPILKKYSIPATIFLVSNFVGSEKDFWPGRLAQLLFAIAKQSNSRLFDHIDWLDKKQLSYAFRDSVPSVNELDEIIIQCKRYTDEQNHAFIDTAWQAILSISSDLQEVNYRATLNHAEIQDMVDSGLIHIGSHTCNHIRLLDSLDDNVICEEVVNSKRQLQDQLNNTRVELFCYPNGDVSDVALKHIQTEYIGACTTVRGWNNANDTPYLLKRISMHDSMTNTPLAFLAKISGWI